MTKCTESKSKASPVITDKKLIIKNTTSKLALSQYHIFSSWNTACSGKFVSTQQILNVLSTGCRMVDFPITNISGEPMICSPYFNNDISINAIPLNTAVQTCMNNAFQQYITVNYKCANDNNANSSQTYTLNNYDDPLFIQLRFGNVVKDKSQENDLEMIGIKDTNEPLNITVDYLNTIAEKVGFLIGAIQYHTSSNVYGLTTNVKFTDLRKKVILLVDVTNIPSDRFMKSELFTMTNLIVGQKSGMMMYPFQFLLNSVPAKNTPKKNPKQSELDSSFDTYYPINQFSMAIPNDLLFIEPTIPQVMELAVYHNVQFIPFLFYKQNQLLTDYINFFQKKQNAFIPIQSINNVLLQENEQAIMR